MNFCSVRYLFVGSYFCLVYSAGGAAPALAQLAVSSYHAALSSSHSSISQVSMHVDELHKVSSPLPPARETQPVTNMSIEKNV